MENTTWLYEDYNVTDWSNSITDEVSTENVTSSWASDFPGDVTTQNLASLWASESRGDVITDYMTSSVPDVETTPYWLPDRSTWWDYSTTDTVSDKVDENTSATGIVSVTMATEKLTMQPSWIPTLVQTTQATDDDDDDGGGSGGQYYTYSFVLFFFFLLQNMFQSFDVHARC